MQCFDSRMFWQHLVLLPAHTLVPADVLWPLPVLSHKSSKRESFVESTLASVVLNRKQEQGKGWQPSNPGLMLL